MQSNEIGKLDKKENGKDNEKNIRQSRPLFWKMPILGTSFVFLSTRHFYVNLESKEEKNAYFHPFVPFYVTDSNTPVINSNVRLRLGILSVPFCILWKSLYNRPETI